jgi:Tfp pilus assembly protein PilP
MTFCRALSAACVLLPVSAFAAGPPQDAPSEPYAYQAAGRRDPFLSLLATGAAPRVILTRGDGMAGILVNEISVRGVMESRGTLIAMIQAPDGKSHIVRPGDRFVDGTVKAITPEGLVIVQDVNDPLSTEKRREVHKRLRSAEEARP